MANEVKLFNKYDFSGIVIEDETIRDYVNLNPIVFPHTFGRIGKRKRGMKKNIVEKMINKLMRGGTGEKISGRVIRTQGQLQGKKMHVVKIIEKTFDIIAEKTKKNPIQVLIKAIENAAPREDTTRVVKGGVRYQVAVDVAPKRRVEMSLRHIALAGIMGSFGKKGSLSDALANEMILAANGDVNSYAIKRRNEVERIARSAR
jgi:small subunit ribosomal protein S7